MFKDFIGHYSSIIDRKLCSSAIAAFESQRYIPDKLTDRTVHYGEGSAHLVSDNAIEMSEVDPTFLSAELTHIFGETRTNVAERIGEKVIEYMNEYSISHDHGGTLMNHYFKMQMSNVGESYSSWHTEWSLEYQNRFLVWMLYLNDIMEGGETEWLYYNRRIQPRAGDLVIWPSHFTHAHRGNPPLDKKKYVITGWITVH